MTHKSTSSSRCTSSRTSPRRTSTPAEARRGQGARGRGRRPRPEGRRRARSTVTETGDHLGRKGVEDRRRRRAGGRAVRAAAAGLDRRRRRRRWRASASSPGTRSRAASARRWMPRSRRAPGGVIAIYDRTAPTSSTRPSPTPSRSPSRRSTASAPRSSRPAWPRRRPAWAAAHRVLERWWRRETSRSVRVLHAYAAGSARVRCDGGRDAHPGLRRHQGEHRVHRPALPGRFKTFPFKHAVFGILPLAWPSCAARPARSGFQTRPRAAITT